MKEEKNRSTAPVSEANLEDALPIQKTGPVAYIAGGVGVLVVLGLVFALSGSDAEEQKAAAEKSEKAADASIGMTKAELEERQAHLKRTQTALIAAANEEAEKTNAKQAADAAKAQEQAAEQAEPTDPAAPAQNSPRPSAPAKSPAPAPKPKPKSPSLDFGADITKSLE